jgi:hypothetical protein
MKKYRAVLVMRQYQAIEFEANDHEHAQKIANGELWDAEKFNDDPDLDFDVYDIEELEE